MNSFKNINEKNNIFEKLINIRRSSKTVKGGRVLSFSALVVVGNKKGMVGFGNGKAKDVATAIKKAIIFATKNMIFVYICNSTLPHSITFHEGALKVFIKPALQGTGVIAGGAMRSVFEVVGITNIIAKIHGSTNPINIVRATIKAMKKIMFLQHLKKKRQKHILKVLTE